MNKACPLVIACMLGFCFAQAQVPEHKFSAQIETGPSIPLGRFAHKSFSLFPSDTSGNAIIGFSADILLKYQFNKSWGASLLIGGSINSQDKAWLHNEIKKGGTDDMIVNVKTDSWKLYKVMPGIYYSPPFSNSSRFSLKPMISAGICKTNVPGFSYSYYYQNLTGSGNAITKGKDNSPMTFCYRISLALDYAISKRLFVLFDANYFNASLIKKYSYFPNWPQTTELSSAKKHYSLSSVNMLVGLGVWF
ncbi:MAG: outer membrane beta-barrel protein [Agriterribacter sp.]